jgi:protein phosphatase
MGTTLTIAYIVGPNAYVVHAGDSRCYLHRGDKLIQITQDQTVAQAYLDNGILSEEQAADSPFRHVLWNVVAGDSPKLFPSAYHVPLLPDDKLLLCTDGLTRHVRDAEILPIVQSLLDPRGVCQSLIEAALQQGGSDNITVLLARTTREQYQRSFVDQADRPVAVSSDTELDIQVSAEP